MDCEKLILLVQERKYLWDQREGNYHMRDVQKQLWKEVSTEMKFPEETIRKRWRSLRDTFRKEFRKQMKTNTGSGNEGLSSSWPFYKQLLFLANSIEPRKMESSIPTIESDPISQEDDQNYYSLEILTDDLSHSNLPSYPQASESAIIKEEQTPTNLSAKKRFESKKNAMCQLLQFDEKLLEIENKKVKFLEEKTARAQDGDYQFLMSLLPYLHDIPKTRKLHVRKKMMEVLINELNQTTNDLLQSTPNCPSDESAGSHYIASSYLHVFDPIECDIILQ